MSDSERAELGRRPIAEGNPSGDLLADEVEELKAEATKDVVHQGAIEWSRVVEIGLDIVASKSKDFTAASYLAVGLAQEEGIPGLADGLGILEGMVEAHWETGHPRIPKRMRGRSNAFGWLAERAGKVIADREEAGEISQSDLEPLTLCSQRLSNLDKLFGEQMGDQAPGLGDLMRALRVAKERLEATRPPEPSADAPAVPAQQSAPTAAAPAARPAATPSDGEIGSKSDAVQWIMKCAAFYKEKEPANPISFRLMRVARWAEIAGAPADQDGKTELLAPPAERIAGLRRLRDSGDHPALLENAEEAFRERPLWLDAQRYAAEALGAMGGPYRPVRQAVIDETRALLARAPTLPKLVFKDGTRFADAETQEWIQQEVNAATGGGGAGPTVAISAEVDPAALEAARDAARELAKKGSIGEAIDKLETELAAGGTARAQFLARFEVAELLLGVGREKLAAPLLEALDGEVVRHELERWEPGLCVEVLRALYKCHRRLAERRGAPEGAGQRADEVFGRLCRVSPTAAAALE